MAEQAEHLKAYHAISHQVELDPSEKNLTRMAQVMEILDHQGLWQLDSRIS
ncbi:ABC transporter ATPase component [Serratia fonticola]|uniref:ABC transporter ATPase component n=1 Tax=Serratia fonticola TaxID=47917 RepID=A0A4U9V7Q0_SERFO|nr:ABC transporter ATPase component [Serratia fonticola]